MIGTAGLFVATPSQVKRFNSGVVHFSYLPKGWYDMGLDCSLALSWGWIALIVRWKALMTTHGDGWKLACLVPWLACCWPPPPWLLIAAQCDRTLPTHLCTPPPQPNSTITPRYWKWWLLLVWMLQWLLSAVSLWLKDEKS